MSISSKSSALPLDQMSKCTTSVGSSSQDSTSFDNNFKMNNHNGKVVPKVLLNQPDYRNPNVPTALLLKSQKYDCKFPFKKSMLPQSENSKSPETSNTIKRAKLNNFSKIIKKTPNRSHSNLASSASVTKPDFSEIFQNFLLSDSLLSHMIDRENLAFAKFKSSTFSTEKFSDFFQKNSVNLLKYLVKVVSNVGVGQSGPHFHKRVESQSSLHHPAMKLVKENCDKTLSDFFYNFESDRDFGFSLTLERCWYLLQCGLLKFDFLKTTLETSGEEGPQKKQRVNNDLKL
jgi:hypothetical protein